MPPLHRMPAFYLVAVVLAVVLGLGLRGRSHSDSRMASEEPTPAPSDPPPAPRPVLAAPPADGILRTPDGLRRKVLIKDLDVVCQDRPGGGKRVGRPLDYFAIRFLYGMSAPGQPEMVLVGARQGPPEGWVPLASVLEWDTRLMARPTPRGGRPPLVIYREEACLRDALAHRPCPRHAGRCPTEGEESPTDHPEAALGMPILQTRTIAEADGAARALFEVASLVRDQAPPMPPPDVPPPDLLPALRRLEIAFAIDTTASMQATIDAARRLAARLAADASKRYRDMTLRLALVEYRDSSPAFGFAARIVSPFTDPAGFRDALDQIEAARRPDGTIDEAVLDGVAAALPALPGEKPGLAHLNWPTGRQGELATKMLVLIGDAPDHARDLTRADALATLARRSGITIAGVAIDSPTPLSRDERARFRAQWESLAEGSFRPLDKASGFTLTVPPASFRLEQAAKLVPMLQTLIDDRVLHARNLAALAAAEAEGRLTEYVNSEGLELNQVAPVLVDLHRNEAPARAQARPDPRMHGRKAPSVRRGWIAERRGDATIVTVEVLMSRDEVNVLIGELTQLQQAAQGTARDLSDLLRIGTAAASGETGFLAADRGAQTFAEHLRRRQGLPPARPDSLLQRTQADLLQADDLYRAALDARLGTSLAELIRRRNAIDWSDPRRTIDGMATIPYALIDF